jgi:hypothetical protein
MSETITIKIVDLATSTDEKALKYLRKQYIEGSISGQSTPYDGEDIKLKGRERLKVNHALQNFY